MPDSKTEIGGVGITGVEITGAENTVPGISELIWDRTQNLQL